MAEAAVLVQTETFEEVVGQERFAPLTFVVPEMPEDVEPRQKASRFIGSVAVAEAIEAEAPDIAKPIESLFEALPLAAEGDEDALGLVYLNAGTDVIERTLKKGHVTKPVPLTVRPDGSVMQHRQSGYAIQANSLRYAAKDPIMRRRTEAETRNLFRTERLYAEGWFEDYSLLVVSRAEDKPGVFFTETMSCSLQLTRKDGDGLAIESAFVAGIREDGGEQHDEQTVISLGEMFGADLDGKSPAEIIDTPILIHNSMVPNGVIDVVGLYDAAAGGTFFGEDKPTEDYVEYLRKCREREKTFEPKIHEIVAELLSEADTIDSPEQAVRRLNKISGKHMVEHAMKDKTIDPRVFGDEAAPLIERGRMHYDRGELDMLERVTEQAVAVEKSASCPSSMGGDKEDGREGKLPGETDGVGSDKYGSLQFDCPKCNFTNTRERNQLIPRCKHCGADVTC